MLYFFYIAAMILGAGLVGWLYFRENRREHQKKSISSLTERLGLETEPSATPSKTLFTRTTPGVMRSSLEPSANASKQDETVSALPQQLPPEPLADQEFPSRYKRLEAILKEKSEELEKKEKALARESEIKKEFDKFKDILEGELKNLKDKNHQLQSELTALRIQNDSHQKYIFELEEKIKAKDRDIQEKIQQPTGIPAKPETPAQNPNAHSQSNQNREF